jgi:hypothetical protein
VTPPRAPCQLVKLLPIAFVPGRHFCFTANRSHHLVQHLPQLFGCARGRLGSPASCLPSLIPQTAALLSGLFLYSINRTATYFPYLLFQTRYGTNCFAILARDAGARNAFIKVTAYSSVVFPPKKHQGRDMRRATTHIRACSTNGMSRTRRLVRRRQISSLLSYDWTSRTGKCESRGDV